MYESHFGMRRRPFPNAPDPEQYYPATSHEQALAILVQAVHDGEGLMLLTGSPGTGKTLLGHQLVELLGDSIATAFLTHSHFGNRSGLLQAILFDLGHPYVGLSEQELRLALTERLLERFTAGQGTLIVLDEAQNLTHDLVEELRLLGNLEGGQGKAVQILLLADPRFLDLLGHPDLASFRQRLTVRVALTPLTTEEAADYLLHHLRSAGVAPQAVLDDEAAAMLARGTGGVPRLLNQAAHLAFQMTAQAGGSRVEVEAALEALTALGCEPAECEEVELTDDRPDLAIAGIAEAQPSIENGHGIAAPYYAMPKRPA